MSKSLTADQLVAKNVSAGVYQVLYPCYCCAGDGSGVIVTGGGGGSKSYGVSNMLQLHVVSDSCSKLTTISTLDMGEQITRSINYSDAHRLWTATMDHMVLVFDIDEVGLFSLRPIVKFSAELRTKGNCKFAKIATYKNQRLILTGGDESEVRVWNFPPGDPPTVLLSALHGSGKDNDIVDGSWDIDGSRYLSASRNGLTKIWETASGTCLSAISAPKPDMFLRIATFTESSQVICGYYSAPKGPSFLQRFGFKGEIVGKMVQLKSKSVISCLHASGDKAAVAFNTGNLELWDLRSMRQIKLCKGSPHELAASGAVLVPNGVVSVSVDFTVRLWTQSRTLSVPYIFVLLVAAALLTLVTLPLIR